VAASYANLLICAHCGRKGLARILAEYTERDGETVTSPCGYLVKEVSHLWGLTYVLMKCSSCDGLTVTRVNWHDQLSPGDYDFAVLYPEPEHSPSVLPEPVREFYLAALKESECDASRFASLLHKTLEAVCQDRGVDGASLFGDKVRELAVRGEIPGSLAAAAGDFGRFLDGETAGGLSGLTDGEAAVLHGICRAVLEYVYFGPFLVDGVVKGVEGLKGNRC